MMNDSITFYYDFSSSYSYIAQARIAEIEQKTGLPVIYRPILLGAVFQHLGHAVPTESSPKMDYFTMDLKRTADSLGIAYQMPPVFPFNAIESMRIFYVLNAEDASLAREFSSRVFSAAYVDGKDMSQADNVALVLSGMQLNRDEIVSAESFNDAKAELKSQTKGALELSVFGAPTFVYQNELFWGADRIDTLLRRITAA